MATDNKKEEDYLDSLLKSVLGENSEENEEKLNSETENVSDEDILGNIEDDLFSKELNEENMSDEEMKNLIFEDNSDIKGSIHKKSRKEKKEKKHRWGKKKNTKETEENISTKDTNISTKDTNISMKDTNISMKDIWEEGAEETQEQAPPEGFEDFFADSFENSDDEHTASNDDTDELYDIFSMSGEEGEESTSEQEIKKLEEEKPSKEKKKKEKNHSGLFGRKNKSSKDKKADEKQEEDALVESDFGIDSLGDIFMGGEERDEEFNQSDENTRLMEEMDEGNYDEEDILEKEKPQKRKKEKKKKDKKPKAAKIKKEKKKKEPRVRKPKEPDEIIKISKSGIVFIVSFIVLVVVSLILGGNYKNYVEKTDKALNYYLNQDYDAAYNEIAGLNMLYERDRNLYSQIETVMYVQRHYTSYKSLYELEQYDDALNTLLRGVKMYDKYKEQARELDCFDDITTVLGWIDTALAEKYGLTESQARELTLIDDRYEYARRIYELADAAEAREKAQ